MNRMYYRINLWNCIVTYYLKGTRASDLQIGIGEYDVKDAYENHEFPMQVHNIS